MCIATWPNRGSNKTSASSFYSGFGICTVYAWSCVVYARYTHGIRTVYAGIRWYTLVVVWYTHGIRVVYGWYLWYPYGIRMVYAWYTRGIVWYTHGIRSYTLVYASGCGLISAAQNRRFQGDTLYTAGMLCPHHAIHWKGTSI